MTRREQRERSKLVREQLDIMFGIVDHPQLHRLQREWARTRTTPQLVEATAAFRYVRDLLERRVSAAELLEELHRIAEQGVRR